MMALILEGLPNSPPQNSLCREKSSDRDNQPTPLTQSRIQSDGTIATKKTKEKISNLLLQTWGDSLDDKAPSAIRLTGTNIRGIPTPEDMEDNLMEQRKSKAI